MAVGLDPALFWTVTPRIVAAIMAGADQRLERERYQMDRAMWMGASLMATGVNAPKKFPAFDKVHRPAPRRAAARQDSQAIMVAARAWNVLLGGTVERRVP